MDGCTKENINTGKSMVMVNYEPRIGRIKDSSFKMSSRAREKLCIKTVAL